MKNIFTLLILLFSITITSQQKVEDDFEGNGTITSWAGDSATIDISFSNIYKEGINTSNTVLQYVDNGGSYANVKFDINKKFDLSTNHTFTFKIYVPSSSLSGSQNNQVSLKLQNGDLGEPWTTQSEVIKNISLNQWQTVSFNFKDDNFLNYANTGAPINRTDFDRVLIQVNGEDNTDKVTAYIDDFSYDGTIEEEENTGDDFDTLVWSDEFDGLSGQVVDLDDSKWFKQTYPIINGQTWANGEIQHYTDRLDNSFITDGVLKILAKRESYTDNNGVQKDFTSARLNSKFAFQYGKVQIRAKMPFGVGTFPALWMLGQNITETGGFWAPTHGTTGWPDCGEIDIIEHWGDNQNFVQSALHNRSSFGGTVNKGGRVISNASTDFHIYELVWTGEKMTFSVDGVPHYVYNPTSKNIQNWPYDAPQYLLFNVAILPNIAANFTESAMEIDYVRVYQAAGRLSAADFQSDKEVYTYPNPVDDSLTIRFKNIANINDAILYDIRGKKVQTFTQKEVSKKHDVSYLKTGVYFLKLATNTQTKTYKIIKN